MYHVEKHLEMCQSAKLQEQCAEALGSALDGVTSLHKHCAGKKKSRAVEQEADKIKKHLGRHKISLQGATACAWKLADGTDCPFALDENEAAAFQGSTHTSPRLLHHVETEHAFVDFSRDKFFFCKTHQRWLIGAVMIEQHREQHMLALLVETTEPPSWESACCSVCIDALPASERGKIYVLSSALTAHVLQIHLYPLRNAERVCPLCDESTTSRICCSTFSRSTDASTRRSDAFALIETGQRCQRQPALCKRRPGRDGSCGCSRWTRTACRVCRTQTSTWARRRPPPRAPARVTSAKSSS